MTDFPQFRARVEIDVGALIHNFRLLRERGGGTSLIAVVKANAYGHGIGNVVPVLMQSGCRAFAVATAEEGATVRLYAPEAMVLILGYTPPEEVPVLSELALTQTVFSAGYAAALESVAEDKNCSLSVHFKVDGGMTRLGFPLSGDREILRVADSCPHLRPTGIYTHFPSVAEDPAFTGETLARFLALCGLISASGRHLVRHAAASAALLSRSDAALDATRPGLALYGVSPVSTELPLRPVMRLFAPLVQIHRVPAGTAVGYGGSFRAVRDSCIGTLPIGYGDGVFRALSGFSVSLLHGNRAFPVPIVGRICMDSVMVDLTGTPAAVGDRVLLFEDPAAAAAYAGTIPYELLTQLGQVRGNFCKVSPDTLGGKKNDRVLREPDR